MKFLVTDQNQKHIDTHFNRLKLFTYYAFISRHFRKETPRAKARNQLHPWLVDAAMTVH